MHIGFILDGNGRWASNKGLPRVIGHKRGAENVEIILRECLRLDIQHVTLYAFSTENWQRPVYEVKALMSLFKYFLNKKLTQLHEENVKVAIFGDISPFSKIIQKYIKNLVELTKDNDGMHLNLALNYGGRAEIVRATQRIGALILQKKIAIEKIDEDIFSNNLDNGSEPDPDLIIRTAGERRLSNFLLWQSAYSELYFSDKTWPDFSNRDLELALIEYQRRTRKFGGLQKTKSAESSI
ncbi:isoprenyl transferase [Paracoccaceae bacterium]|nr:isoprenyl transferase [Paracoccaceae bacterium]